MKYLPALYEYYFLLQVYPLNLQYPISSRLSSFQQKTNKKRTLPALRCCDCGCLDTKVKASRARAGGGRGLGGASRNRPGVVCQHTPTQLARDRAAGLGMASFSKVTDTWGWRNFSVALKKGMLCMLFLYSCSRAVFFYVFIIFYSIANAT